MEKILDSKGSQYLIKWNGLEYEECTWEELPEEDDEAVAAYLKGLNNNRKANAYYNRAPEPSCRKRQKKRETTYFKGRQECGATIIQG